MRLSSLPVLETLAEIYSKIKSIINYPTITVEYPFVLKPITKLARLQIENNFSECTGSSTCVKICPVQAIQITLDEYAPSVKKVTNAKGQEFKGTVLQFQVDYNACVACGLCVEGCPAEALKFSRSFVKPSLQTQQLKQDLVHIPRSMRRDERD